MASNIPVGAAQSAQSSDVRFDDLDLSADTKEAFKNSNELNILIVGKYQVGKSALINSLFYREGEEYVEYANEGDLEPTTDEVKSYMIELHGVSCNIFDTQGLQDGSNKDTTYVKDMKRECKSPHLVIYCLKLDEPVRPEEVTAIKAFTKNYGAKIWENAIFAQTFANTVDPTRPGIDKVEFFEHKLVTRTSHLRDCLQQNGIAIQESVVKRIPFVPTGLITQMNLLGIDDWRINLWEKCFLVMKQEAQIATLKVHWSDYRFISMILKLISRGEIRETVHVIQDVITQMGWYKLAVSHGQACNVTPLLTLCICIYIKYQL